MCGACDGHMQADVPAHAAPRIYQHASAHKHAKKLRFKCDCCVERLQDEGSFVGMR